MSNNETRNARNAAVTRGVTYTAMIMTDGTTSIYGTYRVPTRARKIRTLNMHRAEQVATHRAPAEIVGKLHATAAWCLARSAEHATPEWPAFDWSAS